MRRILFCAAALGVSPAIAAQTFPTDDPVLKAMWNEGMRNSQAMTLLQVLSDSIGPRLTGTPNSLSGQDWIKAIYSRWGLFEQMADFWHNHFNCYGYDRYAAPTWTSWDRSCPGARRSAP